MGHLIWLFKFSFKNIFQQKKIYLFLVINLFIGTFGFLTLQLFQSSLKSDLESRSQNTLTADFAIITNRLFKDSEKNQFEKDLIYTEKSNLIEFFAMLKSSTTSRLVTVRAFSKNYPLYGSIKAKNLALTYDSDAIWIDPELIKILNLDLKKPEISLGDLKSHSIEIIDQDTSRFFQGNGFSSTVYISQKNMNKLGLITEGSTLRNFLLYKTLPKTDLGLIRNDFNQKTTDPTVSLETAKERSENTNSFFKYFTDYLGLVAIISMTLCFISGGYLMRWSFNQKIKEIALLKTLGLSDLKIQIMQTLQILFISIMSFTLSIFLFILIMPFINQFFQIQNLPFVLGLSKESVLFCGFICIFGPLIMYMPINVLISKLNPKNMFLNQIEKNQKNYKFIFWHVTTLIFFWLLSFYQIKSYKLSFAFTFGIFLIIIFLKFILYFLFRFIKKIIPYFPLKWTTTYAIRSVINRKQSADIIFLTLTMSVAILTLLPHIKQSIISEISPKDNSVIPRLFLFDIQSNQKSAIQKIALEKLKAELNFIPLVRSRILKINSDSYDRINKNSEQTTREQDEEVRFRNRGVNLTYESELKPSEKIVKGVWNKKRFNGSGLPEISLEEKYAERISAKLNDVLTFDIQGLEIKATVTSFRKIKWTSFNPNFFILFQPGVLEEAPQNFLASVSTTIDYSIFQENIVENFPNVSIVDVKQTVTGILAFVSQMSMALQAMAIISILLGLFIFVVLIRTQIKERLNEFNLLKILGTETLIIKKIIFKQFLFVTSISLLIGLLLGLIISALLIFFVFGTVSEFDYLSMILVTSVLMPITYIIIYFSTRFLDQLSPLSLIRSD